MTTRIRINPQEEIVLHGLYFYYAVKVTSFKTAIKNELVLEIESGVHSLKRPIKNG